MTWNHPLWKRENRANARQALEKLAPSGAERLAQAPTAREKDYLKAVGILFSDKEKSRRDQEYAEFMARQLAGLLAQARGQQDAALQALRQAAGWEEEIAAGFGPPNPVKPSHELLGEALLAADRPQEALEMFRKALERHPNRALSLQGLMRSAAAAGDQRTAQEAEERLEQVWDRADEGVGAPQRSSRTR